MGIESTECGAASGFISLASAAAVTCKIMKPEFSPASANQKRRQLAGLRIGHLLDAPLGNSAQRGERDGHLIGGHRQRLAVKIAAADHFARTGAGISKDERIVRGAVEFDRECRANLRERVAHRSVNLRRAAQAVRVLHARVLLRRAVRFADFAAAIQPLDIARGDRVSRVRPHSRDARVERRRAAAQRVERQRRRDVRRVHRDLGVAQGERQRARASLACR